MADAVGARARVIAKDVLLNTAVQQNGRGQQAGD
jgi:hypothetical protein